MYSNKGFIYAWRCGTRDHSRMAKQLPSTLTEITGLTLNRYKGIYLTGPEKTCDWHLMAGYFFDSEHGEDGPLDISMRHGEDKGMGKSRQSGTRTNEEGNFIKKLTFDNLWSCISSTGMLTIVPTPFMQPGTTPIRAETRRM